MKSRYEACDRCLVEGANITAPFNTCECAEGFTLVELACENKSFAGSIAMNVMNAYTNLVTICTILMGIPLPITWKIVDISQLFSLYYFSGAPNFRGHQELFRSLRYDSLSPIIPNPSGKSFYNV